MTSNEVLLVVLAIFAVLLVCRVAIAWCLLISGSIGLILLTGVDVTASALTMRPYSSTAKYMLAIIPMYILMGMFALHANIPQQFYRLVNTRLSRLPGGVGLATVVACAGFAAVSGSSAAMSAIMSRLAIPELLKYGYSRSFAAGIVAGSGTIGAMIPPSILLVLYGAATGVSIGQLLIAGIVPGVGSAAVYAIYIFYRARKEGLRGPMPSLATGPDGAAGRDVDSDADRALAHVPAAGPGPSAISEVDDAVVEPSRLPTGASSLDTVGLTALDHDTPASALTRDGDDEANWWVLLRVLILALVVVGGVYAGWFTATESGAIGASAAVVMMIWELRRSTMRDFFERIRQSLAETAAVSSMAFSVLIGASVFSFFLTRSGMPSQFTGFVSALNLPPWAVMGLLLLALIPLGMILESLSLLLITVPLLYPAAQSLGFDGVWLGIVIVKMIEIGVMTPPVGVNVYIVAGASGVPAAEVFRGTYPFMGMDLAIGVMIFFVPGIALWLPSLMAA